MAVRKRNERGDEVLEANATRGNHVTYLYPTGPCSQHFSPLFARSPIIYYGNDYPAFWTMKLIKTLV